ncbi:hypothetical protein C0584_00285 [Candidatus Parcubacteria bacterium]|nr:MAG: hypothetical protein C0584_00285 [Candidatus Parcubacteria bacterium]
MILNFVMNNNLFSIIYLLLSFVALSLGAIITILTSTLFFSINVIALLFAGVSNFLYQVTTHPELE